MKKIFVFTGLFFCLAAISSAQTAEVFKSDAIGAETQENYELAAKAYENAAKAFKEQNVIDTVCVYRAGYNYIRIRQFEKAIPFLQECIALKYNPSRTIQLLADTYVDLKDCQKAEEVLLEGKTSVPEAEADFDKKLAYLYFNTGQYEKAANTFGKLNSLLPGDKNYMYLYGFSLERIRKYDEAIEVLEAARQLFPDDKKSKKILGVAYFEQTDLLNEQEVKRYESLKNAKLVDYINTKKKLGHINAGYEEARVILEESLKDFPDDKLVINSLYKIYKKQGNDARAAEMEKLLK